MSKLILFNKPYGVLCQFSDGEGRPTLSDFVKEKDVYPAGRLDMDTEGLVLLTDDGKLQHSISDPSSKFPKTYLVQVEGIMNEQAIHGLENGVVIEGRKTLPAKAVVADTPSWLWKRTKPIRFRKNIPTSWLELTIVEGRNRQVRKMTASVGHPCLRLIRTAVGPYSIEGLLQGMTKTVSLSSDA